MGLSAGSLWPAGYHTVLPAKSSKQKIRGNSVFPKRSTAPTHRDCHNTLAREHGRKKTLCVNSWMEKHCFLQAVSCRAIHPGETHYLSGVFATVTDMSSCYISTVNKCYNIAFVAWSGQLWHPAIKVKIVWLLNYKAFE